MPPPGCPIPEWIYPGRVLASRHNPNAPNACVWIDSIRYAETGGFYITLRRVLSFAPMVVDRFCVTEAWALGLFENTYQPTDQWEPHPERSWDETLEREFIDGDHTCEIALRDDTRTWNIESLGAEGTRMTMEVSREIDDEEVPEGYMEPLDQEHQERLARLFDLRGAPPGAFARDMLPHLMMPPAETVPMEPPVIEDAIVIPRVLTRDEVTRLHEAHEAGPDDFAAAVREIDPSIVPNTFSQTPRTAFLPVHNRPGSLRDSLEADTDTFEAGVRAMHQAAENDPDMRVISPFMNRPLMGFRALVEAAGPMPTGVMAVPAESEIAEHIREGHYTEVSMSAMVPYQLDAPQNNPLWPAWLPYPPNDGQQWHLRVRRMSGGSSSILAYPEFQPDDELIWFCDPSMTVQNIGTVQDYPRQGNVPIILDGTTTQVEANSHVLWQIMSHQPARVLGPDLPPALSIGAAVSLVGGGLIGTVVANTPSGTQVSTHDGVGSVVEFEHGALEPYRAPSDVPIRGSIIRAPNGVVIGRVQRVVGTDVTWATSDGRIYTNTEENLREQGGSFEAPNLWYDPRTHQPPSPQPEKPRPTVYDRILEDDDDI